MRRPQKTRKLGYHQRASVEHEGYDEVRSTSCGEQRKQDGVENLFGRILERNNLNQAYLQVVRNKGAAGADGMTVDQLLPYLKEHREELLSNLRQGNYKPQPVLRVEIPKPNGGVRKLGIPTVIDRMLQQAINQVLQPLFEPEFSDNSYGFRPNRSAHDAVKKAKSYYEQGYRYVVDIDMKAYFDTVNHDKLMYFIERKVKDKQVLKLIRQYLMSGVMENGLITTTEEGTPQGGNLMKKSIQFLEEQLKLTVNREKSAVGSPLKRKFLGFCILPTKKGIKIRPHAKAKQRVKSKLKQLTKRNRGRSIQLILKEIKQLMTGWINYYGIGEMKEFMRELNGWLKRRIRQYIWKQWKNPRTKRKNLIRLGIDKAKAYEWSNTRKGIWSISKSHILHRSLTDKELARQGYEDISLKYQFVHSTY